MSKRAKDRAGLINNFLALIEHTIEGPTGRNTYTIRRTTIGNNPDDFANAVNIGSCALFNMANEWPDLSQLANIDIDPRIVMAQIEQDELLGSDWLD
jgi:hypothetical protein